MASIFWQSPMCIARALRNEDTSIFALGKHWHFSKERRRKKKEMKKTPQLLGFSVANYKSSIIKNFYDSNCHLPIYENTVLF